MADPVRQIQAESRRRRLSATTRRSLDAALKKLHKQPRGLEIGYGAYLVTVQRGLNKLARSAAEQSIAVFPVRQDGPSDDIDRIFKSLKASSDRLFAATGAVRIGVTDWGQKAQKFSTEKYNSEPMNLLGIGPIDAGVEQAFLDSWATENLLLIQNTNAVQTQKLQTLFLRSLRDGTRAEAVQAQVGQILGVTERHQRLIARDQIGKLVGQLDREKQTSAGVEQFIWRTAEDERVRPAHVAINGKTFTWENPPDLGIPGTPIQCRCTAEPDIDALLGESVPVPVPVPPPLAIVPPVVPPIVTPKAVSKPKPKATPKPKAAPKLTVEAGKTAVSGANDAVDAADAAFSKLHSKSRGRRTGPSEKRRDAELAALQTVIDQAKTDRAEAIKRLLVASRTNVKRRATGAEFAKSLSKDDRKTLALWKSNGGFTEIRKVQDGSRYAFPKRIDDLIRLERMAQRAPEFTGNAFRGITTTPKIAKKLAVVGTEMEMKAWESFTTSRKVASTFGEVNKSKNVKGAYVRWSVKAKKGTFFDASEGLRRAKGVVLDDEQEVLAPEGTRFKVVSSVEVKNTKGVITGYRVKLEEI